MKGSQAQSIQIMTYNIHRWEGTDGRRDIKRLAEVIRCSGADVVALNEVLHPITDGRHIFEPLRDLAEILGMHHVFGPSGWIDFGPSWQGAVGNALLSRYPLVDESNTCLPITPWGKQRSLLSACLGSGPAQGLYAYVTHLDHAWEGTRLLQIAGVLKKISRHRPHFLAGDFNTPGFVGRYTRCLLPPVVRRMQNAGYQDAFFAVGSGSGRTFPSRSPLVRFDYLWMPRWLALGLRQAHTLDLKLIATASDHRPVVAEWAWPAERHGKARYRID